jgi:8-oxo-dGTP pyrophosphatase MutT (NUDIX family)
MQLQFSAGIIVYYPSTKGRYYLVLQAASGYWGFAKGKIEKGESKKDAALRELKEESNLDSTIIDGFEHLLNYFFRDRNGQMIKKTVYFFVGEAKDNSVTLSQEHISYQWLLFQDAVQQVTYPNDRDVLIKADGFLTTKLGSK